MRVSAVNALSPTACRLLPCEGRTALPKTPLLFPETSLVSPKTGVLFAYDAPSSHFFFLQFVFLTLCFTAD